MAKRIAGVKTGRRAGAIDREKARRLAAVYRRALSSPDGLFCLNPDGELSEQTFIDALNPNLLIWALENFAEHGTFHFMDQVVSQNVEDTRQLRTEFEGLRSNGATYEDAVQRLVELHKSSKSSVERKIKIVVAPLTQFWHLLQTVTPIEGD